MAPFWNLRSKIDRAIVAWLQQNNVANVILPANQSGEIDFTQGPVVIVRAHHGVPEANIYSGTWRFQVEVSIYAPAAPPPPTNQDAPDPRTTLDGVIAETGDALSQSADEQATLDATADGITEFGRAIGGDMADFTMQSWDVAMLDGGSPRKEGQPEDTTAWKEILAFECTACPSNVS